MGRPAKIKAKLVKARLPKAKRQLAKRAKLAKSAGLPKLPKNKRQLAKRAKLAKLANAKIKPQTNKTKWFYQRKNFGLGNFVMATPALRIIGRKKPVNVYFDDKSIASLFKRCSFINIVGKKPSKYAFGSSKVPIKINPRESDSEAYVRTLAGGSANKIPNTYVDSNITAKLERRPKKIYIAVFHGCLNQKPKKIGRKDIGFPLRKYIINTIIAYGMIPVVLGNKNDQHNFWGKIDMSGCVNFLGKLSLRDSVSILSQCNYFISNDTGLYHVAGALEKPGLVVWCKTSMHKNKTVFGGIDNIVSKNLDVKYVRTRIGRWFDAHRV